jgi:hypothetical protein
MFTFTFGSSIPLPFPAPVPFFPPPPQPTGWLPSHSSLTIQTSTPQFPSLSPSVSPAADLSTQQSASEVIPEQDDPIQSIEEDFSIGEISSNTPATRLTSNPEPEIQLQAFVSPTDVMLSKYTDMLPDEQNMRESSSYSLFYNEDQDFILNISDYDVDGDPSGRLFGLGGESNESRLRQVGK